MASNFLLFSTSVQVAPLIGTSVYQEHIPLIQGEIVTNNQYRKQKALSPKSNFVGLLLLVDFLRL